MEQGAAPAGGPSSGSHPGGVGAPPGWPLRAACQELADDPGTSPGRKRGPTPEGERRGGAPRGAPASVIGRWSLANQGSARPQGGPRVRRSAPAPVGAPPPLRGDNEGRRTRRRKEYGRRSVGFFTSPA